jgi:hypothetical protein
MFLLWEYAWSKKATPARKNMYGLPAPFCLEKEMVVGLE